MNSESTTKNTADIGAAAKDYLDIKIKMTSNREIHISAAGTVKCWAWLEQLTD